MTDIISRDRKAARGKASHGQGDAPLIALVEMLFFAYRDFTGEADAALAAYGLGRAHHRVLHFVNRRPGMRVADLLGILKITKQSLGRVLRELIDDGWIEQSTGAEDRRERLLTLTARGRALAGELQSLQARRMEAAMREINEPGRAAARAIGGATSREQVGDFLFALIAQSERPAVRAMIGIGQDGVDTDRAAGAKKLERQEPSS